MSTNYRQGHRLANTQAHSETLVKGHNKKSLVDSGAVTSDVDMHLCLTALIDARFVASVTGRDLTLDGVKMEGT